MQTVRPVCLKNLFVKSLNFEVSFVDVFESSTNVYFALEIISSQQIINYRNSTFFKIVLQEKLKKRRSCQKSKTFSQNFFLYRLKLLENSKPKISQKVLSASERTEKKILQDISRPMPSIQLYRNILDRKSRNLSRKL